MYSVTDRHSKCLTAISPIAQADVLKQCVLFQIPNDVQVQQCTIFRIFLEFTFTNQYWCKAFKHIEWKFWYRSPKKMNFGLNILL